jgi:Ca2+/H+ antiporter, TMEM165/GDT1 family
LKADPSSLPIINTEINTEPAAPQHNGAWSIFISTFLTVLLAELGDKTQLTTLLMTAESHAPGIVFAGAASALVLTSLLGVLLGQWLAKRVPPALLEKTAGVSLLLIALWLVWDVVKG